MTRKAQWRGGSRPRRCCSSSGRSGSGWPSLLLNDLELVTQPGDAPKVITWPGSGRGTSVELLPLAQGQESRLQAPESDWSFLNLLNAANSRLQSGDSLKATFVIGGRSVTYDFTINGVNPFTMREVADFDCPESLD